MTVTKEDKLDDADIVVRAEAEPSATLVTAVGVEETTKLDDAGAVGGKVDGPPVPAGHTRYYCEKCRAPYDLPEGATTWRCPDTRCHTFNSTTPGECECCTIM